MLLDVVIAAEANGPPVRRLQARASVGVASHMRALDRPRQAPRHAAMMLAHPGTMGRALTAVGLARPLALKPVR